jgi:SAM-dependent methyltransferase
MAVPKSEIGFVRRLISGASFPSMSAGYGGRYEWQDQNTPQCKALRWVEPGRSVLEIGTGAGGVVRLLRNRLNCRVVGVDMDARFELSASQFCEKFVVGDITRAGTRSAAAGEYDYVLLFDVLEHLVDPGLLLRQLAAELLRANDKLIITLPNVLVWHTRCKFLFGRFEYTEFGTLDRTHLRFFTPASARRVLQESGFRILKTATSWNVPVIGWVRSWLTSAEIEDLEARVRRRFPTDAGFVLAGLAVFHAINRLGAIRILDAIGTTAAWLSPTLFGDHTIFLAVRQGLHSK